MSKAADSGKEKRKLSEEPGLDSNTHQEKKAKTKEEKKEAKQCKCSDCGKPLGFTEDQELDPEFEIKKHCVPCPSSDDSQCGSLMCFSCAGTRLHYSCKKCRETNIPKNGGGACVECSDVGPWNGGCEKCKGPWCDTCFSAPDLPEECPACDGLSCIKCQHGDVEGGRWYWCLKCDPGHEKEIAARKLHLSNECIEACPWCDDEGEAE